MGFDTVKVWGSSPHVPIGLEPRFLCVLRSVLVHRAFGIAEMPKLSQGQLEPLFRRLNLANIPGIYQQVADRAGKENWYRDFLAFLLVEEVAFRKQTRLQRLRKAHFPFFNMIDEFDFSFQSTLRQRLLGFLPGTGFR
jgi:IstB-like ATP binding protein